MSEEEEPLSKKQEIVLNNLAISYRVYQLIKDDAKIRGLEYITEHVENLHLNAPTEFDKALLLGIYSAVANAEIVQQMKGFGELTFNL